MKHMRLLMSITLLLSAACTKELDLKSNPGNENTVITFHVKITDQLYISNIQVNTLKIYDNYDYFLSDTLPLKISEEYKMNYHIITQHTLVFPKENNKELWIRVTSRYSIFKRDFIYKSSIFIPLTDSLIVRTEYENWILE